MNLLIAEDEVPMQKILRLYLEKEGFGVFVAEDGEKAVEVLDKECIDLAILDWMMPKMDGIEVAKYLRTQHPAVKILFLTARSEVEDELQGLSLADDYIRKPFEPRVLVMRIQKLLAVHTGITEGKMKINLEKGQVVVENKEVALSKKELELLLYLFKNKGRVLPRELLLDRVWGMDYEGDERTVDTHIRRLRSKIGEEKIKTYRGLGYSLEVEGE